MGLVLQKICCPSHVIKIWKLVQETSKEKLFIKSRQIAWQMPAIET